MIIGEQTAQVCDATKAVSGLFRWVQKSACFIFFYAKKMVYGCNYRGSGAAGLMAAKRLSDAGLSVCIPEARDRIGGRIHTIILPHLPAPPEGGAEFIHGNLEVTLHLLKEAEIGKKQ